MAIQDTRSSEMVEREGRGADTGESQSQWSFDSFYREQGWEEREVPTHTHFCSQICSFNKYFLSISSIPIIILSIANISANNMDKISTLIGA